MGYMRTDEGRERCSEKENKRENLVMASTPELTVLLLTHVYILEAAFPRCHLLCVSLAPLFLWIEPVSLVGVQP